MAKEAEQFGERPTAQGRDQYWMLMKKENEKGVEKFETNQQLFLNYWNDKESKFVEYYVSEYSHEPGWCKMSVIGNCTFNSLISYINYKQVGNVLPTL